MNHAKKDNFVGYERPVIVERLQLPIRDAKTGRITGYSMGILKNHSRIDTTAVVRHSQNRFVRLHERLDSAWRNFIRQGNKPYPVYRGSFKKKAA